VLASPIVSGTVSDEGATEFLPPPAILAEETLSEAPVRPAAPAPTMVAQGLPEEEPKQVLSSSSEAAQPDKRAQWGLTHRYELAIPSLGVRVPVYVPDRKFWDAAQWDLLEEQMQVGLLYGAVAYPHSVAPGSPGALIIAGHSSPPNDRAEESVYGKIFARLPELQTGSEVSVRYGTTSVRYVVENIKVVPARDTSILVGDSRDHLLKLITCYPVGSVKDRLVITARPAAP